MGMDGSLSSKTAKQRKPHRQDGGSDVVRETLYMNLTTFGVNPQAIHKMNMPEHMLIDFTRRVASLYAESRMRDLQERARPVDAAVTSVSEDQLVQT